MTTIYVDADACPVKDEVVTIAIRHGCRAVMVCNGGIRPNPHPLIDLAIVEDGPDAAEAGASTPDKPGLQRSSSGLVGIGEHSIWPNFDYSLDVCP